jgi:hypothetical protein
MKLGPTEGSDIPRALEYSQFRSLENCGFGNFSAEARVSSHEGITMAAFFLWCILFILCWPLALLALVLYPIVWLLTLPFRIVGIAVHGVFALLAAILFLPARLLRGPRAI